LWDEVLATSETCVDRKGKIHFTTVPLLSYCAGLGQKAKFLIGVNWHCFFDFTEMKFILQELRICPQMFNLLQYLLCYVDVHGSDSFSLIFNVAWYNLSKCQELPI